MLCYFTLIKKKSPNQQLIPHAFHSLKFCHNQVSPSASFITWDSSFCLSGFDEGNQRSQMPNCDPLNTTALLAPEPALEGTTWKVSPGALGQKANP